jgi:hypothetical protein
VRRYVEAAHIKWSATALPVHCKAAVLPVHCKVDVGMSDPYHNPDALPSHTVDAIIARMEERGRHPFFLAAINQYVATLERDRKISILELGCGTGVGISGFRTLGGAGCFRFSYIALCCSAC